ncbi:MAG: DUF4080 domain-containing protein [Acidaminococcaceae bacterium]|nr:DUF4080 domain-containing protein [Acidaminococcaceae bacterium]
MQAYFIGINSKYVHTALGVRYVAEYCRMRGYSAHFLEATVNEPILSVLTCITEQIEKYQGDSDHLILIGLDVHIWNRNFVFDLGNLLRKVMPEALLLLGGPEVMFHPQKALTDASFADFIVCGEGEEVVASFLHSLSEIEKEKLQCINNVRKHFFERRKIKAKKELIPYGLAYIDAAGDVIAPKEPLVLKDLDRLPFPYPDLEQVVAGHKIVYYEASRGCPFHCAYCLSGVSHSVRRRKMALVLADMERFVRAGASLVKFVDRTYNLDESFYLPIMEYLAKADTNATFHFEIKADILSSAVIDFLKTVPKGRFQLEIGVQSTNPQVLQAIGRKDDWKKLRENVSELLQAGNIHIHMDLIAGLPLEDLKSFARSFDDVFELHPHALQLGFLKVLPGTVMEQSAKQHKMVYMAQPPYEILATKYVSYKEIRFLKILEEVFDATANSGRFSFSLTYLIKNSGGGSAFAFFAMLTEWYRENGKVGLGHNGIETARLLIEFVEEKCQDILSSFRELLRLDVLLHLPNFKPGWLAWRTKINYEKATEFWRNETIVCKYLPDYTFKNWRSLHKKYALEEFLCNPWTREEESVYILVNYEKLCLTRIETSDIIIKSSKDGGTLKTE